MCLKQKITANDQTTHPPSRNLHHRPGGVHAVLSKCLERIVVMSEMNVVNNSILAFAIRCALTVFS